MTPMLPHHSLSSIVFRMREYVYGNTTHAVLRLSCVLCDVFRFYPFVTFNFSLNEYVTAFDFHVNRTTEDYSKKKFSNKFKSLAYNFKSLCVTPRPNCK